MVIVRGAARRGLDLARFSGPGSLDGVAALRETARMPPPDSVVRVAAIDLGKARVGIAVSDDLGLLAHPRPFLDGKNRKPLIAALVAMVRDEGIQRFLLGLPLEMTGEEGPAARRIMQFAQELSNASGVEVELIDERLTTVEAAQQLRRSGIGAREGKGLVDGVAAAVILQSWLDARRDDDSDEGDSDYSDDDESDGDA
jgi:putative Holliday junction resolvase